MSSKDESRKRGCDRNEREKSSYPLGCFMRLRYIYIASEKSLHDFRSLVTTKIHRGLENERNSPFAANLTPDGPTCNEWTFP